MHSVVKPTLRGKNGQLVQNKFIILIGGITKIIYVLWLVQNFILVGKKLIIVA